LKASDGWLTPSRPADAFGSTSPASESRRTEPKRPAARRRLKNIAEYGQIVVT
jgi:hypothetical protein